jgi:acyl-CoA synthetase (AMP-forming)/AMP-acid ligase II
MLYDRWRRIAQAQADQLALFEATGERCWTFDDLYRAAEKQSPVTGTVSFPHGGDADFILSVLRSWRCGKVVCPLESGQEPPPVGGPLPEGVIHLKMTSATTGTPRLVAFTARQLMADADNIVETMGLRRDWPNIGVISLAHSYGFSNLVLPLLLHGIPLILVGSALPEALRSAAVGRAALTLAAVPALWKAWSDAEAIPTNVRLAISAGAPLPLGIEQGVFARHGLKIHNFYGSSECGGIAYDDSLTPRPEAACAGAPMKNVNVSVAPDGCVEVRSEAVAETYWPSPAPELGQGIFRTRDVGQFSGGLLYVRGRASDQINVAGRKVLPEAIEAILVRHPEVRACLAFGVPSSDTQRGETIVACVAGKSAIPGEELKQFALANLPAWQVPREWWFVDNLEVNARGKLSRAEWRKRYLESARGSSPLKVNSPRKTS